MDVLVVIELEVMVEAMLDVAVGEKQAIVHSVGGNMVVPNNDLVDETNFVDVVGVMLTVLILVVLD